MNREDAIRKVKACLDMARSGEASEAATAMRQAQAMMARYGIDHPEILATSATEISISSSATERPALYESSLASLVARSSGCTVIFKSNWGCGKWSFIGCSPGVDIAAYSMDVLLRQLRKARRAYMDTKLRRYKRTNKTIRADAYCEGWVYTVSSLLTRYEATQEQVDAVAAYVRQHHPTLGQLRPTHRSSKFDTSLDQMRGHMDGRTAELRSGVATRNSPQQLEVRNGR
ncbi:MAG: hypothetical protein CL536_04355 [Alcaligenaceae bacterium]|nr:hypothetical protein [Alcaligenaceae bacterium]